MAPNIIVHADAQVPSMITRSPDARSALYLARYSPFCPPRSSEIVTVAVAEAALPEPESNGVRYLKIPLDTV